MSDRDRTRRTAATRIQPQPWLETFERASGWLEGQLRPPKLPSDPTSLRAVRGFLAARTEALKAALVLSEQALMQVDSLLPPPAPAEDRGEKFSVGFGSDAAGSATDET